MLFEQCNLPSYQYISVGIILQPAISGTAISKYFPHIYKKMIIYLKNILNLRHRCSEEAGDWWRGLPMGRVCGCNQPHS